MSEVRANSITNAAGTGAPDFPNGLTTASGVSFPDGTSAAPSITNTDDTNTGVFFPAADTVAVATGGSERVRVDSSGNVGIGTASPTHNAGTGTVVAHINGAGTQAAVLHLTNGTTGATGIDGFMLTRWNDNVNYVWTYENEPIAFGTNNLERFRIGSAGQLSVGATGADYGTSGQALVSGGSGAAPSWSFPNNLNTNRTNWSTNGTISAVVGQLAWKNYGNSHTIFDASQSTSPDGTSVNNTNAQNAWVGTYPTLMGWNGSQTYGVRVDSARVADSAGPQLGSTWQTVTRLKATNYVNTTGRHIFLAVSGSANAGSQRIFFNIDGLQIITSGPPGSSGVFLASSIMIPPGATYSWGDITGTLTSFTTWEMR